MSLSALSTVLPSVATPVAGAAVAQPAKTSDPSNQEQPPPSMSAARETETAQRAEPVRTTTKLTPEQEAEVRELQRRDAEVRAHEQAHASVGGQYAGSPTYETTRGPDNRTYAVGGEVEIDLSPVPGDPAATIEKMAVVKRAALAPMEPSAQDRRVAQKADQLRIEAERELRTQQSEAQQTPSEHDRRAPLSLVREATGLYERIAQAFRPETESQTLAIA